MTFTVLYEDFHCLAVAKPAPLMTQAPPEVPSLEAMVKAYLKEKYQKPAGVYLGIPHRLDRPVSGVVVFARNTKAAQRLAVQFQEHQVRKVYWAYVSGCLTPDAGTWVDTLRKVPDEARAEVVPTETPGGKEAILDYRVLSTNESGSLIELAPRTGRMHQLRIQAATRGYPVWGDALYGSMETFGPPVESRERIIALHARRLTFYHPIRREEAIVVTADLPDVWQSLGIAIPQETSLVE